MASSATLSNVLDRFPAGTTVGAYKVSDWGVTAYQNRAGVAPPGSAVATATVTSGSGALAFTGLVEGTQYITGAQVSGTWTYGPQFSPVTGSNGALYERTTNRDQPSGYPSLDANSRVPSSEITPTVINVQDTLYGATADGTTNDRTAINSAIAAAEALITSSGRPVTVLFPPGLYYVNSGSCVYAITKSLSNMLILSGYGAQIKLGASCPRFIDFNRTADYDVFQNLRIEGFRIDANNVGGKHHVVIGCYQNATPQARLNFQDITVRDVHAFNIVASQDDSTDRRVGVEFYSQQAAAGETGTYIRRIRIERVRLEGGNKGFNIVGARSGSNAAGYTQFIDDITITDCWHDTGILYTALPAGGALNYQVGSLGYGGRLRMARCYGKGSGDVGIEIDGMDDVVVESCTMEEHHGNGFHLTNFNYPAQNNGTAPGSSNNTLSAQRVTLTDCHSRRTSVHVASSARGFNLVQNNSLSFGQLVLRNCSYYRNGSHGSLWTAGEALLLGCPSATGHRVEGFRAVVEGIDIPAGTGDTTSGSPTILNATGTWYQYAPIAGTGIPTGAYVTNVSGTTLTISANATATNTGTAITTPTGQTPSLVYCFNGAHTLTTMRGVTCKLAAAFQTGAPSIAYRLIEFGGTAYSSVLDLSDIGVDVSLTGAAHATQATRGMIIGNQAATLSGKVDGYRVLAWTGGGTNQGILFGSTSNLTFPTGKDIAVVNSDFNIAALSSPEIAFSATSNANNVRLEGNAYTGGSAVFTIAAASALTIPAARFIALTGNTSITSITAVRSGQLTVLKFAGTPTLTKGSNLKLNADFVATADDAILLACDGTNWYQVAPGSANS